MKKFVFFTLIAALAAGGVFAQTNADGIGINAWGRGVFVPLASYSAPKLAGEDLKVNSSGEIGTGSGYDTVEGRTYAGVGASWGGNIRTDFRVNGNAEFIGFQIQIHEGGIGDLHNIWAKPFGGDILKLTIGGYEVDNLRGKVGTDTGFENFVVGGIDEDSIFKRFNGRQSYVPSAIITSEPMEGLFIGLEISGLGFGGPGEVDLSGLSKSPPEAATASWTGDETKLQTAYRFMQIGFGYVIPDIGHLRAQWIGGYFGTMDTTELGKDEAKGKFDWVYPAWCYDDDGKLLSWAGPKNAIQSNIARIEAAFALTAVDNLLVDLGLKFWLPVEIKDDSKFSNGVDLGLGATFRADAFAIAANVTANFGAYTQSDPKEAKTKTTKGMGLGINLIPTYDLDAATIGASIGMRTRGVSSTDGKALEGDNKDNTAQFGFGGFVKKDLGSGHIKAGLAYTTAETTNGKANGSGVFTIPIVLEYAFF
jgi:hypothetical protein